MDSPQSIVSPLKNSSVFPEPEKQNANLFIENAGCLSRGTVFGRKETITSNPEDFLGILEVYIHQARDIHNICIYQKQDVYAKLCLTSNPENTVSTKIINGGGRNPIFNQNLKLNVHKVYSSLKCEIWMLSRVRNYLEDQLLGFALVPLSEVLLNDGKLERDFSLSSTDLFHSPAGFVQLSLSYVGASPDVIPLPTMCTSIVTDTVVQDKDKDSPSSVADEFEKIEFPDPKIANENHQMVEEYFGIECVNQESDGSDSLVTSDNENQTTSDLPDLRVQPVESFSTGTVDSSQFPKHNSPLTPSSVSTNGTTSASLPPSSESSETPLESKSQKDDPKEKNADNGDVVSNLSGGQSSNEAIKPLVTVNIEQESKVVQQDIVDMYMKSMQQFTESLAKMKLPMDYESGPISSGNSSSDQKSPASKNSSSSRVFYGSRAFF